MIVEQTSILHLQKQIEILVDMMIIIASESEELKEKIRPSVQEFINLPKPFGAQV